jgi:hypothetical protein
MPAPDDGLLWQASGRLWCEPVAATAVGVVGASLKLIAVGTFNGAGGGSTFLALNCLIAKNSFGNYSVTFVNFPADGNYIVSLNARSTLVAGGLFANVLNGQTAFGFTIQVWSQNNTPVDPVVDFTVWHA